jgi:hypothetical protein
VFERAKTVHELDCAATVFCISYGYYTDIQFVLHRKHFSATNANRLMPAVETDDVCYGNHREHRNVLGGHNVEFEYSKAGGIYSDRWTGKGWLMLLIWNYCSWRSGPVICCIC